MLAISVENICKKYQTAEALRNVSFEVEQGELYGLIGADGAGKTTLFQILTTLQLADSGSASVEGLDVVADYKEIRNRVGYMPGRFSLYHDLTVEENLNFFATLFGTTLKENYDLVRDIYVQIEPFKKRRAGKLSGGMKQRLALCCALIHRPSVLFLDEPTTGVDVVSRAEFWDMLKRLKTQGITILVSTPYMDETTLCDRIALILSGQILTVNTPKGIISQYPEQLYAVKSSDIPRLIADLRHVTEIKSCFAFGEHLHVTFKQDSPTTLGNFLGSKGHTGVEIKPIEPHIEDCFIRLMNE